MSPVINEIGLKGYRVIEVESKHASRSVPVVVKAEPEQARPGRCPCCGSAPGRFHSKGRYLRQVRHMECFGKPTVLKVYCRRWECLDCARSFVAELPGILPYRQSTEPLREQIYLLHHHGIPSSCVAQRVQMGQATVGRIYQQFTVRKASERISLQCPRLLGIDEHTLHKGGRMVTTFCDLKNHRVFDVVQGRSQRDLEGFLRQLQGRDKVQLVCIDLSSPYRAIVQQWFPNARIVADRFHVVRIIYHHFLQLARQIVHGLKNNRGLLCCLRKRPENLTDKQRQRLDQLLNEHPALRPLYQKMHDLRSLMNHKHQTKKTCRPLAQQLLGSINDLRDSSLQPLLTLADTLEQWSEPIACMWRFSKNNGITEGFHRKMKLIQRRAYGFRNFDNYRLRVIAQCG
jgi:transposase